MPTAAPTVEPTQIEMTGDVRSISAQAWIIDGQTIEINAQTEINGNIAVGQRVKVKGHRTADGRLVAAQIELASDNNGNQNNNDEITRTLRRIFGGFLFGAIERVHAKDVSHSFDYAAGAFRLARHRAESAGMA